MPAPYEGAKRAGGTIVPKRDKYIKKPKRCPVRLCVNGALVYFPVTNVWCCLEHQEYCRVHEENEIHRLREKEQSSKDQLEFNKTDLFSSRE